jgi:hypothetical protein
MAATPWSRTPAIRTSNLDIVFFIRTPKHPLPLDPIFCLSPSPSPPVSLRLAG